MKGEYSELAEAARHQEVKTRLMNAAEAVDQRLRKHEDDYEDAVKKAKKKGEEVDLYVPMSCRSVGDIRNIAGVLDDLDVDDWMVDDDVQVIEGLRFTSPSEVHAQMRRLMEWPEFSTLKGEVFELRWSRKPILRNDVMTSEVLPGRVQVVSYADRQAWTGKGIAPSFRLTLSLPFVMLATEDELARGLHHLLMYCGKVDLKPVLRKPDIIAHAATLGRFGTQSVRETAAIAHAHAATGTHQAYERFGYDPKTGQGLLYREDLVRQQVLAAKPVEASNDAKVMPMPRTDAKSRASGRA